MTKEINEIIAVESKTSYRVINKQGQKLPAKMDPKTGEIVAKNAPFCNPPILSSSYS